MCGFGVLITSSVLLLIVNYVFSCGLFIYSVVEACPTAVFLVHFVPLIMITYKCIFCIYILTILLLKLFTVERACVCVCACAYKLCGCIKLL